MIGKHTYGSGVFFLVIVLMTHGSVARAVPITYELNSELSFLNVSGNAIGVEFVGQSADGLTNNLGGFITADLDGQTLTFDGGSALDVLPHPSRPFLPAAPPEMPLSEDNYGASDPLDLLFRAVVRDAVLDIFDGSASFDGPVTNLVLGFTQGRLDIDAVLIGEFSLDLSDQELFPPQTNQASGLLTRELDGVLESITLPIDVTIAFDVAQPQDSAVSVAGEIVATRIVPEPVFAPASWIVVLCLGMRQRCRRGKRIIE